MPLPTAGSGPLILPMTVAQGGTGATTAAVARTNLGLIIGTDVLAPNGDGSALTGIPTFAGVNPFTNTTASTSSSTGAMTLLGGLGVAKDSWFNGVRIGRGEGNAASNTALGAGVLAAITSGTENTAGGSTALAGNSSGTSNTAFGDKAMQLGPLTTSNNSAFGSSAGRSITGTGNSVFGANALGATSTTANHTVAFGYLAGRFQRDGTTALSLTGDGNIFIGKDARGMADAQTNAITIGYLALSEGSNTIIVGNSSTTFTNIWGLGFARGHLWGCTLSNNVADATNDIDIALGECRESTGIRSINCAAMTKRLDANWAVGTAQGFRNSAIAIADTTYHIYAVATADGTQDYYAHTSTTVATVITALQAESGGALYLYARRIGSIVRAGGIILPFTQNGDDFTLTTPVLDVSVTNLTTARTTYTLASIPTGLRMKARFRATMAQATGGTAVSIHDLTETDAAPSLTVSPLATQMVQVNAFNIMHTLEVFTNTSSQIGARSTGANTTLRIATLGWVDTRGRLN